jgi:hypothetical protein
MKYFTRTLAQSILLVHDYECGAGGEMIGMGNRNTRRKPGPIPISPPQIPNCFDTGSNLGRRDGKAAISMLAVDNAQQNINIPITNDSSTEVYHQHLSGGQHLKFQYMRNNEDVCTLNKKVFLSVTPLTSRLRVQGTQK